MGVGGQRQPRLFYPRECPRTHCIGGWGVSGPGWNVAENTVPTVIRSPDRPARNESLYRLRYPSPQKRVKGLKKKGIMNQILAALR
jgi:hypothetical protein